MTAFFNRNQKAAQFLDASQKKDDVTYDRIKALKRDIPTRWHSIFREMIIYLSDANEIDRVSAVLFIEAKSQSVLTGEI